MELSSAPWFPGFVTGMLALTGVITVALIQVWREHRKDVESTKRPDPPTTQQVWDRLDRVERVLGSSIVLLGEVAEQWSGSHPPVLSRRHVAVVSDAGYMPPEWDPDTK